MSDKPTPEVADILASYPPTIRKRALTLRALIFAVAAATRGVGPLHETLKWGEPAYLTTSSGSGSTIRIGWKKRQPTRYAMYFNCQTTLVDSFKTMFPTAFKFEGNRALVFDEHDVVPVEALRICVAMALTYHANSHQKAHPVALTKARTIARFKQRDKA
jgi:hypothetical protein